MKFKVGQKIVGIEYLGDGVGWERFGDNPGPKANEVYTANGYEIEGYVYLVEFPIGEGFDEKMFRPLHDDLVQKIIQQVQPQKQEA